MLCTYKSDVEKLVLSWSKRLESNTEPYAEKLHHRSILNRLLAMIDSDKSKHHLLDTIKSYEGSSDWLMRDGYKLLGDIRYEPAVEFLKKHCPE